MSRGLFLRIFSFFSFYTTGALFSSRSSDHHRLLYAEVGREIKRTKEIEVLTIEGIGLGDCAIAGSWYSRIRARVTSYDIDPLSMLRSQAKYIPLNLMTVD
ncbi:hypothetical protein GYMLUDRAFT_395287 [Collybiopsis luxurians FD-317 M1]|uniref:Uncharacterized protein n=1 Tax=Collybiopsis luxurians FD-317 M1 TaxID=944289 RepID=A0A0D0C9D5_9AGAR|nr:hypothetical protein GYMLUDRAFT_395287 [Collybiopsis luxurians FD-317 M1]